MELQLVIACESFPGQLRPVIGLYLWGDSIL